MNRQFRWESIYVLFLFSGMSGLIYQVIWVRMFGNTFGGTVYSASMVTAIYMCGLGVGGYFAGILADRKYSQDRVGLLRLYAFFEIAIGSLGFLVACVLPRLEPVSVTVSSYVVGDNGWYFLSWGSYLFRYGLAVFLLFPITLLMGGTLTLLVRFLLSARLSESGYKTGLLYGINTAGAAMGCLAVDTVLVPNVGLFASSTVAVVINLAVGLGALRLAKTTFVRSEKRRVDTVKKISQKLGIPTGSLRIYVSVIVAIFLCGFVGMGMEIVWFRFLTSILGEFRAVFSLLLAVILVGIWLGSFLAGFVNRWLQRPLLLWVLAIVVFVVSSIVSIYWVDVEMRNLGHLRGEYVHSTVLVKNLLVFWYRLIAVLVVVGVPSVMMGFSYPLANAIIQDNEAAIGRRAGLLYLYNTLGGVCGSLCAGFLLIPGLGTQISVTVFGILGLFAMMALLVAMGVTKESVLARKGSLATTVLLLIVAIVTVSTWSKLPKDYLAKKVIVEDEREAKILSIKEDVNETIAILEIMKRDRGLFTNGYLMTGTYRPAQRYMRAFSHIPLLQMDQPEHVLNICFGVGNTVHAASLHPSVTGLEVIDLSENVLSHAPYFKKWNKNVLEDPRVKVFVNDGRQHLRMKKEADIDLITLEPPPIAFAGVSSLYSTEFYELARSRLRKGGFITQWLPAYQVPESTSRSVIRTFIDVFPGAVLLSGNKRHLILMGRKDMPIKIDPQKVLTKIASNPALQWDLENIRMGTVTEIVGTFVCDYETLLRATKYSQPVNDDYPLMEYDSVSVLHQTRIPRDIFNTDAIGSWCPSCFEKGRPDDAAANLGTYLSMLQKWYETDAFLVSGTEITESVSFGLKRDDMKKAMEAHPYLDFVFDGYLKKLQSKTTPMN